MRVVIWEHPRLPSPEHFNDIANTPLWSCLMAGYAGAALQKAGFDVELLDMRGERFAAGEERLLAAAPGLLAVHAVYFWERTAELFASLARLRAAGLDAPICLFGFYPSLAWRDLLAAYPVIDYIAVGEPEQTLAELAGAPREGRKPEVAGLARRQNGAPCLAVPRPPRPDLDVLPEPLRPGLAQEETVSILASRGCYNACDFCLVPAMGAGRNPWRGRSVDCVAGEIAALQGKGKHDFYFVDPNFIGPGERGRRRAWDLAQALGELGITFGMECRATDLEPGLTRALAQAGLSSLLLGLESGSAEALARMGKNSTPGQNLAAIEMLRGAGLEPEVGFIMFEPRATLDDLAANLAFLERARLLDRLGRSANLLYHNQIALKGTRLYERALAEGRLLPEGLLGFEGRLAYADPRVGWLAGVMRGLCLRVLRAMGRAGSGIHFSREYIGGSYAEVNGLLREQFARLLGLAASWQGEPPEPGAMRAAEQAARQLDDMLARARAQHKREELRHAVE